MTRARLYEPGGGGQHPGMDWSAAGYAMGLVATMAFAITAVAAIKDRGVDLFGVLVLGAITAVGGGTVRDLILQQPVFWSRDLNYLWVALGASAVAFFGRALVTRGQTYAIMLYLDGFGAALFAVLATDKVWELGFGLPAAPVILGVITGIGGGLLRDVLAGRSTLLMSRELYAVPLFVACTAFSVVLAVWPEHRQVGMVGAVALSFTLRAAAIHWNLAMPRWLLMRE